MKKIVLEIEDSTYAEIRTAVAVKGLSGQAAGILDALVVKLVEKIEAGEETWHVQRRRHD